MPAVLRADRSGPRALAEPPPHAQARELRVLIHLFDLLVGPLFDQAAVRRDRDQEGTRAQRAMLAKAGPELYVVVDGGCEACRGVRAERALESAGSHLDRVCASG